MIDKNYFLTRLQAGESMDQIGEELAKFMNEAVIEHKIQEQERLEAAKREEEKKAKEAERLRLATVIIDAVKDYAKFEGISEELLELSDEDVLELANTFSSMCGLLTSVANFGAVLDSKPVVLDDDILAKFAASLM